MLTETLTWYEPAERLPDADLTVLVETRGCEEPIWLGALDGEQWRDTEGMPIEVVRWAEMPRGGDAVGVASGPIAHPMMGAPASAYREMPCEPRDPVCVHPAWCRHNGRCAAHHRPCATTQASVTSRR